MTTDVNAVMAEVAITGYSFSDRSREILKDLTNSGLRAHDMAKMLLHELIQCNVISDAATYEDVKNNTSLKKALLLMLAVGLPDKIGESWSWSIPRSL